MKRGTLEVQIWDIFELLNCYDILARLTRKNVSNRPRKRRKYLYSLLRNECVVFRSMRTLRNAEKGYLVNRHHTRLAFCTLRENQEERMKSSSYSAYMFPSRFPQDEVFRCRIHTHARIGRASVLSPIGRWALPFTPRLPQHIICTLLSFIQA